MIIALIEDEPDMEVVAEAANGREAIEQLLLPSTPRIL
jgi:YesN/AraC family two-component response regulator